MRRMIRTAAAVTAGLAAATVLSTGAAEARPADFGCPSGAACIYRENADPVSSSPSNTYWTYGAHNLSSQYGSHWVYNNQTGGATINLCTGYNGTGDCSYSVPAVAFRWVDLGPINSIVLNRP
ncbi:MULTISPECIES: hypothetical protein [unclassified Streptomyces]|uniref:hypothetical protein n=1 Tax=unclassified Streptomyces TaxID=2593676 RepID=UPI00035CE878|nr:MULTISPECIES: hypothetical protein [unclassified Streptomyces]EYT81874.1 hypothetical protein CF54_16735 [Streptomyces sp. Tu 6176]